jgi:hypothetical protein
MTKSATITEPNMPWLDDREDRFFRRLSIGMLLLFVAAGIVLNTVQLPEVIQKNLVDVSPRLAKLILEKQKVKPPPKPEAPPPEKEKQPEKKKEIEKTKVKKEVKKDSARDVAKKSGLIALSDELDDLREIFDADDVPTLPQQTTGSEAVAIASASDLLSSSAQQSSGGIQPPAWKARYSPTTANRQRPRSRKTRQARVAARASAVRTKSSECFRKTRVVFLISTTVLCAKIHHWLDRW